MGGNAFIFRASESMLNTNQKAGCSLCGHSACRDVASGGRCSRSGLPFLSEEFPHAAPESIQTSLARRFLRLRRMKVSWWNGGRLTLATLTSLGRKVLASIPVVGYSIQKISPSRVNAKEDIRPWSTDSWYSNFRSTY